VNKINGGIIYFVLSIPISLIIGYLIRKYIAEARIQSAENEAVKIREDAEREGESKKREFILEAKEIAHKVKEEADKENQKRRLELQRLENRLMHREESLDRRSETLERREQSVKDKETYLNKQEKEISQIKEEQLETLEKISNLSQSDAREYLINKVEKELDYEFAKMVKEKETIAKEEADKKAREIISLAIQRCAADHVVESTISVVSLPNDEMKGRIIGREGRNIRTLESLTGIDLIIDDTPEAVVISGFDPLRREVARIALEKLIVDGRIHPARIEEVVKKVEKEIDNIIRETGEQAAFDIGAYGIHAELIKLLGKLRFRTSYAQNVLQHSIEVAFLCGIMASELGVNVKKAKRAGLLHDVGKAVDHEVEGPHAIIGADLARKYGESQDIVHAIAAHHEDVKPDTVMAVLVQAADALSGARPGARREMLESYVRRLEDLEGIAKSFAGVKKSYAIQAGREIRIVVLSDKVSDAETSFLCREVAKKIESGLSYPGQIKVTVIRETRAVEYAK